MLYETCIIKTQGGNILFLPLATFQEPLEILLQLAVRFQTQGNP